MALNPELRRYCWLELTPHRLIATPVIIGLIVALISATMSAPAAPLAIAGLLGFALAAALFGSNAALNAVTEEVRERTWDAQRMSALTPAALAFGKVFGAPVYGWYAGAWCLALYLFTGLQVHGFDALLIAVAAVCSTVALHATSVIMSAVIARAGITRNLAPGFAVLILWLGALPWHMFEAGERSLGWWGVDVPQLWFVLVSSALFAVWALLGAARTFATEVRVRQLPWAWPAFCLYLAVWGGGLIDAKAGGWTNPFSLVTLMFFLAAGVGAYLMLLSERTGAIMVTRVLRTLRGEIEGGLRRALQETPVWVVSLVCCSVAALLLLVLPWSSDGVAILNHLLGAGKVMPLALAAMLLRDAGIYCIFALTRFPRRAVTVTLVYVVLLDVVLPMLMSAAGLATLAFVVFPVGRASAAGAFVIFMVHAAIAWAIAVARWRAAQQLDLAT